MSTINTATRAYIECMLWVNREELGRLTIGNLTEAQMSAISEDVNQFYNFCLTQLSGDNLQAFKLMNYKQFGHDYFLTRNHHGAGFWDRGLGELGDLLTSYAHSMGSTYEYLGDDGNVYTS
jgi:hypothetical protein